MNLSNVTNYLINNKTNLNQILVTVWWKDLVKQINFYYPIVLSIMVTVGNTISLVVFSTRTFKNNASCFFIKIKLINDVFNVYVGTWRYVYVAVTDIDLKNVSSIWCHSIMFCVYYIDPCSSWLNVFTSLDRLILVLRPSFYGNLSHVKFRNFQIFLVACMYSILGIIIFSARLISQRFFVNVKFQIDNSTIIIGKCSTMNQTADLVNLIVTILLPFVIMITSSLIMGFVLIRSKLKMTNKNNISKKSWTFIKTIVLFDFLFFVFNLPRFMLNYLNITDWLIFGLQLSTIFKYLYHSMSIFFFICINNLFRESFLLLFSIVFSRKKI